jgi:hypothetical protein
MKPINQWTWKQWVLFTNVVGAIGIYVGFVSSGVKLSSDMKVYVAVPIIAFLNLIFLVVRPRMQTQTTADHKGPSPIAILYLVLAERPLLTVLCILQLGGASKATATTIQIAQASMGDYVRSLPNPASIALRMKAFAALTACVALIWFLGAIGLWLRLSWAWWLALVLNGLAAGICALLQIIKPDQWLFDIWSTLAVVLLLLQPLRKLFQIENSPAC